MKRFALAIAAIAAVGFAQQAGAADLGRPIPVAPPAPYMVPYYNWTGFYVGLNGGGGWGNSTWDTLSPRFDTSGAFGGGTVGYNWQNSQFVFGVEADVDWANIKGSDPCVLVGGCQTKSDWFGTARGRVGVAFDRVMPYITGGLAFGDISATTIAGTTSTTNAGWAAGAGVEFVIAGPWTAKVEYMHIDLGSFNCTTCAPINTNVDFKADTVKGGVNVRF